MSLKTIMMGQQPGFMAPDVTLTGDPGVDQPVLQAAGYLGGKLIAAKTSAVAGRGVVVVPCDADSAAPLGALLNGPGEFAGAIGPSGSKKTPFCRVGFIADIDAQAYDTNASVFVVGAPVYCGGTTHNTIGLYTDSSNKGTASPIVGYCLHIPTVSEPYLTVLSVL